MSMRAMFACAAMLLLLTGCSQLPIPFDVTQRAQAKIPKGTAVDQLVGSLGFGQFANLDFSQSQEFQSRDVQKRHVESARVKSIEMRIIAPEGQNFDFIESISFFIEAPGQERK